MAREYDRYLERGATIAGVVIDAPPQNAAMVDKLALPFPILADPGGERAIKPFDAWDVAGNMAKPAIVALAPDREEIYRYVGVDFMDRPNDAELLAALDGPRLPAIVDPPPQPPLGEVTPGSRAMSLADLGVYLRGVRSAMAAMANRARDPFDQAEAARTAAMAERFMAALGATRRPGGDGTASTGGPRT